VLIVISQHAKIPSRNFRPLVLICVRNTPDRAWCDMDSSKYSQSKKQKGHADKHGRPIRASTFKLMAVVCSKLGISGIGRHISTISVLSGLTIPRVGEDKTNGTAFANINCYSSTNLVEWNYEGAVLTRTGSGDTGPGRVIERPKIMFNKKTNKYVLWMHIDSSNYAEAKIGVATGDSVCGKYNYLRSEKPLGFESRDSGVYVDDDGKGYLLTEDVCS
jgi:hypothetical protein